MESLTLSKIVAFMQLDFLGTDVGAGNITACIPSLSAKKTANQVVFQYF